MVRLLGDGGCGWWRLAGRPQTNESMSSQWFGVQGLVSRAGRYPALQH